MSIPSNRTTSSTVSTLSHPIPSPPLDCPTPEEPTQILTFTIPPNVTIEDPSTPDGKIWDKVLDTLQGWDGFRKLHWGRYIEESSKVQVLVFRETLSQHHAFLSSPQYTALKSLLASLNPENQPIPPPPQVLHTNLQSFTSNPSTFTSAPITGTAIYLTTSQPSWAKTWSLWATVVPYVKGCLGCRGGWILESVDGHEEGYAYVVFVGWESISDHEGYHHTKEFARNRIILGLHNKGYRGYGHVKFLGKRDSEGERKRVDGGGRARKL